MTTTTEDNVDLPSRDGPVELPSWPGEGPKSRALPRAAGASCALCGAVVLLLEVEHRLGTQHYRYTPFLLLFGLMLAAMTASMFLAARDAIQDRSEWRSLGWALVGLLPFAFWAAVGVYGFGNWRVRYVPSNVLMNVAKRAGASLMEAEAAWRYPNRIESRWVVMFYRDLDDPRGDIDRMERYLEGLEPFLGRPLRSKIHWVRGELLGMGGLSLYGLALGSSNRSGADGDALPQMDRHEAAHAVIAQCLDPDSDPPTFLSEGWAQANGFGWLPPRPSQDREIGREALSLAGSPEFRPLDVMLGPDWYHQDSGPVYTYGPHVVRHLIRRHGIAKFLRLYTTIRPDSAGPTFRAIYGADPASIERDLFAQAKGDTAP